MSEGPSFEMLDKVFTVCSKAARAAGKHLRVNTGAEIQKTKSAPNDLVTKYDLECQKIIEDKIKENFPDHEILGEESVAPGSSASTNALEAILGRNAEWVWVIDPIDGTTNFVHSIPCSVVSIGVAYRGRVEVGVIYDPYRDELFQARRGYGATLNGQVMSISTQADLMSSVLAVGFPASERKGVSTVNRMTLELGRVGIRAFRDFGSAALHMAWVACGRLSGFYQLDLSSWDLAAGSLLISEAGGRCTNTHGSPYDLRVRNIVASNGLIHDSLLDVVKKANAYQLQ